MSKFTNGEYRTKAGSSLTISGKHGGIFTVYFDWFEEPDACCECEDPHPDEMIDGRLFLWWSCEECGGGRAEIMPVVAAGVEPIEPSERAET